MDGFQRELIDLLPRLRRFARSLTGHVADADDLVQLSVERALERRAQWRPGTRLDSWMFRIMKNGWIDETRARSRKPGISASEDAVERVADPAAPDLDARLQVSAVARAMAGLPPDQREAVALVLVEELSYREAADVLDIPIGTLTSRLVRGRQALQAELAGSHG